MSREKVLRRILYSSHWQFIKRKAAKFEESEVSARVLKVLCQEFYQEFRWYMFPSELRLRMEKVWQRERARKKKRTFAKRKDFAQARRQSGAILRRHHSMR